jgi:hypothetical protein
MSFTLSLSGLEVHALVVQHVFSCYTLSPGHNYNLADKLLFDEKRMRMGMVIRTAITAGDMPCSQALCVGTAI